MAFDEEYAQVMLASSETALTLDLVRTLTPNDVCMLFALLRKQFEPDRLAELLTLVSEETASRLQKGPA